MARRFGTINKMSERFEDYNYAILGVGGIGKTTLAYEVGKIITGNNEGTMIITFGLENKPTHIPNAFADSAPTFGVFMEIVDDLVNNKADYPYTKFIALDSIDEMFRLADEKIVDDYNASVDFDKRIKSIKQAYGGYQAGENKSIDLVLSCVGKLDAAGYKIIYIGHTKTKSKVDNMTGITYEQLTCSADNKYYNAIKDKVNLVATGYYERDFKNLKQKDNPYTKEKGAITTGELVGQRRSMSLVDDENVVDTKCHFEYIAPKIDFSAQSLINAVKEAIRTKIANTTEVHEAKPLPTPEEDELGKYRDAVRSKYRTCDDKKRSAVYTYLKENNIVIDEASMDQLKLVMEQIDNVG